MVEEELSLRDLLLLAVVVLVEDFVISVLGEFLDIGSLIVVELVVEQFVVLFDCTDVGDTGATTVGDESPFVLELFGVEDDNVLRTFCKDRKEKLVR